MEEEGERGGVKEEKGFQKEVREQGPHTSIFIHTKSEKREKEKFHFYAGRIRRGSRGVLFGGEKTSTERNFCCSHCFWETGCF